MATDLHSSTVGFSVRNALVMLGEPKHQVELTAWLQRYWPARGLDEADVEDALLELERRGLVERASALPGWWRAQDDRFFRNRPREQDGGDGWEGWAP
jgi:hypothetical protein